MKIVYMVTSVKICIHGLMVIGSQHQQSFMNTKSSLDCTLKAWMMIEDAALKVASQLGKWYSCTWWDGQIQKESTYCLSHAKTIQFVCMNCHLPDDHDDGGVMPITQCHPLSQCQYQYQSESERVSHYSTLNLGAMEAINLSGSSQLANPGNIFGETSLCAGHQFPTKNMFFLR